MVAQLGCLQALVCQHSLSVLHNYKTVANLSAYLKSHGGKMIITYQLSIPME